MLWKCCPNKFCSGHLFTIFGFRISFDMVEDIFYNFAEVL